jgi:hypothetical protein
MMLELVLLNLTDNERAKGILRAELARRDISTQQLTDLLIAQGVDITRAAVDNRISRGNFTADFFVDCFRAIGCRDLGLVSTSKLKRTDTLNGGL